MKLAAWLGILVLLFMSVSIAAMHDVVCNEGNGSFQATSRAGVTVLVGAEKAGGFSKRSCQATLSWGKQKLQISTGVSRLDLDVFGADLGFGEPVAAFTTVEPDRACCVTYRIYSVTEPPRLLRTITGGSYFAARIRTSMAISKFGLTTLPPWTGSTVCRPARSSLSQPVCSS